MKKYILLIVCLFCLTIAQSQSKIIADAYIKRAEKVIQDSFDFTKAAEYFEKALSNLDTITESKIARLGSEIYYEIYHKQESLDEQLSFLQQSKEYFDQYTLLTKNLNSEEYKLKVDELLLPIIENLERLQEEIKIEKEEEKRLALERKKIDSLKTVWKAKSALLSIKYDSIYSFNKNNVALFKDNLYFGLIDEVGAVLVPSDAYEDVVSFDGLYIFKDKAVDPTKLFYYNSNTKTGYQLPLISDFFTLSTHYGKVMLPRGNGRLVTYPNNAKEPFIYDLNFRKVVKVVNEKDLLKTLEKADKIDNYKKDGEVKINKEWYIFGGHLGGGIHPIYAEDSYQLKGFLCSIDGRFLNSISDFQYIGSFYNGKFEALKGTERIWINQNGTKVSAAKSEGGVYTGKTKVVKLEDGSYQLMQDGMIIYQNEKLEKMPEFLRNNK